MSPEFFYGVHSTVFTKAAPQPLSPRFTAAIHHPAGIGRGYFTATVSPLGAVTVAGRTGDGKPFTSVSRLGAGNPMQYRAPLGRGAGRLTGTLEFIDMQGAPDTVVCVDGYYVRPSNNKSMFFQTGFASPFSVTGGTYTAPAKGQRALGFLNSTNGMGNLFCEAAVNEYMDTSISMTFTTANRFVFAGSANKPVLAINPVTGIVTGTVQLPAGTTRTLRGVLTLDSNMPKVYGHVSGTTRTGSFIGMP